MVDVKTHRMPIGGEWVESESGKTMETINPATGEKLGEVPLANGTDVDRAVRAAKRAFPDWSRLEPKERGKRLSDLGKRIAPRVEEISRLETLDSGNPLVGMRGDVLRTIETLEYYAGLAYEFRGQTIPGVHGRLNYVLQQPFGVVGRIIPYNHPFQFAATRLAAPLLAGNTIVIKPPEQAPLSALELYREIAEVFPPGVVNIVTGDGPTTGDALVRHPEVPRIAFIGSVETGRLIMRNASDWIKKVSLELGGKNPMIVFPDADVDKTVGLAVAGMNFTRSQGQSCGSTSRLFLHESLHDEFVEKLVARVRKIRIGMPIEEETEMGCLISKEQFDKVMGYIRVGQEEGAKLLTGGKKPDDPRLQNGFFLEPTVFDGVKSTMRIAQEEIFGPVLSVITWNDYETMLEQANSVIYGLTAGIVTGDLKKAHETAARVEAGYVWINGCSNHFLAAPFGGWKQSGLGREESLEELLSYTQTKNVNVNLNF
ncbi:MAG: aldehyde dehydrogenase family protein [Candidatus Tectomicrobia bacterium]|uniref:Aldehyde dehydrogenase family protein n=1 Tax=Tectimicrobiota bacterium TaxID=2528274 RepID=A0A932GNQ4_UNCTE|nr:aldehyde dehydrogenase family protein [Candidatus Tectomicrobia bacterium]